MFRTAILLPVLVLVTACGGGGGGGSGAPAPSGNLTILTQTLDQGNVGHAFFQQLDLSGGTQPYTWWVSTAGSPLPNGISLTQDGRLAGTPTESVATTVLIVVQDITAAFDVVSLPIEVRDVEIAGAPSGTLTPGQQLSLAASGGVAGYQFSLQVDSSGATLTSQGQYTAGSGAGLDVVRATDIDGFYEEMAIVVGDDPFVGFSAEWGTTDVWWLNWDVAYDPSPIYATDIDEVLVALGLRASSSTEALGTEADQLARLLLIRRCLGWISKFYGNGDNGNPLPGGLSISFVGPAGPGSGTTPGVGGVIAAGSNRYGSICVRYGPSSGVVGTAWLDSGNANIEHNCGDPSSTPLGVFAKRKGFRHVEQLGGNAPDLGARLELQQLDRRQPGRRVRCGRDPFAVARPVARQRP